MTNLQNITDKMSSLDISVLTQKAHKDILKSIRVSEEAWNKVAGRKFALGSYLDKNQQERPMYNLTKTECLYVATKFNDVMRAQVIMRWEELETKQNKPITTLQLLESAVSEIKAKNQEILELKPKAEIADKLTNMSGLVDIGEVAKLLNVPGYGRNKLYDFLRDKNIIQKYKTQPFQIYVTKGFFVLKEVIVDRPHFQDAVIKTMVTQKGVMFIDKILKKAS